MENFVKGFLVDAARHTISVANVERKCEAYYKLLDCNLIDIVPRKIGGKYYDIILDDEGLMNDECIVTALTVDGEVATVGNILVVGLPDEDGNETDLSDADIRNLKRHIRAGITEKGPIPILCGLDY